MLRWLLVTFPRLSPLNTTLKHHRVQEATNVYIQFVHILHIYKSVRVPGRSPPCKGQDNADF